MSAIYGLYHLNKQPVTSFTLKPMESALNHWQADSSGMWADDHVGMGQLMLWNTPESLHEKLPLHKSDKQLTITADARIDNRQEIGLLLGIGNEIKNIPDSELILLLYEKYNTDCLKHIVGDFAFAIWDGKEQKLFCARDHLGVKPFFYYSDSRVFAFATEKKGILCLDGVDASIDMQFVYTQMQFQPIHFPDATLYQKIKRLAPSHCLTLHAETGELQIRQYWEPDVYTEIKLAKKEDYYEALHAHFEEAVRCRLRSAYPVGAELSGGIDSSAIVGVAQNLLKRENKSITTFSHVLPDHITDEALRSKEERKYIDEVIRFNGITNYEYITSTGFNSIIEEQDYGLAVNDGLDAGGGLGFTAIKNRARDIGIRTMFSGFPGDEMVTFRGQNYPLDHLDKKQYLKFLFTKFGEGRGRGINAKLSFIMPYEMAFLLYRLNIGQNRHGKTLFIDEWFNIPKANRKALADPIWKDPWFKKRFRSYRHFQASRITFPHVGFRIEAETRFGLHSRVEPRFPMADIRLVQFYLSMPNELKYGGPVKRYSFIQSVLPHLPEMIAKRDNKAGNVSPFRKPLLTQRLADAIAIFKNINGNSLINSKFAVDTLDPANAATPFSKENMFLYKMETLRWIEKNLH